MVSHTDPGTDRAPRPRGPLAGRTFRYIWIGLVVSLLGDQFYRVALTISVASDGAAALASLGLVLALPTAVFGLLSGVLIDRWDTFRTLVATDLVRAAIVTAVGVVFLSRLTMTAVLTLAAFLALASVLFTPAIQAMMPKLSTEKSALIAMDTWILGAVSVVGVVGPVVAGGLLRFVSPQALMFVDAATFLWSAVMLLLARRRLGTGVAPSSPDAGRRPADVADVPVNRDATTAAARRPVRSRLAVVFEGLRFLLKHPVLRPCFTTFPVMEFALYAVPFLLPLMLAGESTGSIATQYGVCLAAMAAGRVAGLTLVNRSGLKHHRGWILRVNFLVQGAALLAVAAWHTAPMAALGLACVGVASGAAQVAMASYVQLETPAELRGRVFSAIVSIVSWLQPFGAVAFGVVAAVTSPSVAMAAMGAILLVGGVRLFLSGPLAAVR